MNNGEAQERLEATASDCEGNDFGRDFGLRIHGNRRTHRRPTLASLDPKGSRVDTVRGAAAIRAAQR